jgi:hypothetical protein
MVYTEDHDDVKLRRLHTHAREQIARLGIIHISTSIIAFEALAF